MQLNGLATLPGIGKRIQKGGYSLNKIQFHKNQMAHENGVADSSATFIFVRKLLYAFFSMEIFQRRL